MRPNILIVDDEPSGREVIKSILIKLDYTLTFATDGADALQQAADQLPDLILLDVMMPRMDGFEVCRRLRANPTLAEVPVVLVTALDDRQARLEGIEAGADDFVTKPVDRVELRARVRSITRLNRFRRLIDERANLQRQIRRMTALREIDLMITAGLNLEMTLNLVLQKVIEQLNVDAAAVLLLNPNSQILEYASGLGFRSATIQATRLRLGSGLAGRAAYERQTISASDLNGLLSQTSRPDLFQTESFRAYYGVPLIATGEVKGVLEVFQRTVLQAEPEWLEFLEVLGRQAAIAIDNSQLFNRLQQSNTELALAYDATIEGWSRALDLRDKETEGHSQRVTEMTLQLAQILGVSNAALVHIRRGALLHDIGKLGVPDAILLKPGPLTEAEWEIMRKHPKQAHDLLAPIAYLRPALDIPYYHHEKWDGTGYPQGLKGEQIPLAARIFTVADVWDALRSDRPYRPGWPEEKVHAHIVAESGKHFDPAVVTAFMKIKN